MGIYNEVSFNINEYVDIFKDLVFSLGIDAVEETSSKIIVRSSDDLDYIVFGLKSLAEALEKQYGKPIKLDIVNSVKQNKDWVEEYRKGIQPVSVGDFYIHTSWQEPKNDMVNILIDPALAFGSGHHETTYSCLEFLQKYASGVKKAIDVGCGSGILSIALAKLGVVVDACDTDSLAINSLLQNSKLNNIDINNHWVGSIINHNVKYNLVVANIIADVILMLQYDLKHLLDKDGILILSGILDKYENEVKSAFKDLILIDEIKKNEWLSLVYKVGNNE